MDRSERIGVVGAGLMGREIALIFALAGYQVLLADQSTELLGSAMQRLGEIVDKADLPYARFLIAAPFTHGRADLLGSLDRVLRASAKYPGVSQCLRLDVTVGHFPLD